MRNLVNVLMVVVMVVFVGSVSGSHLREQFNYGGILYGSNVYSDGFCTDGGVYGRLTQDYEGSGRYYSMDSIQNTIERDYYEGDVLVVSNYVRSEILDGSDFDPANNIPQKQEFNVDLFGLHLESNSFFEVFNYYQGNPDGTTTFVETDDIEFYFNFNVTYRYGTATALDSHFRIENDTWFGRNEYVSLVSSIYIRLTGAEAIGFCSGFDVGSEETSLQAISVPEPCTISLLGLSGLVYFVRKRT
jgi:hypothetical protein